MENKSQRPKLVLILGSGFSKEAGIPTTVEISEMFLKTPKKGVLPYLSYKVEEEISKILKDFWKSVFSYLDETPSIVDHFTLLDLAANSGHNLGTYYNPKRLRAIRRMSIHRVFSIVTEGRKKSECIHNLFLELNRKFALSIVTLNWDIVVERHLDRLKIKFYYPIETLKLRGEFAGTPYLHDGLPLIKMHGSTNWLYCDSCKRIYARKIRSAALNQKAFIEADDFKLFEVKTNMIKEIEGLINNAKMKFCLCCGNILAGRVATFSYRKAFSIAQFQTIWERAHAALTEADTWLFIGYSMPEADFEFGHLLKSAQLARKKPENWSATVILKEDEKAADRYKSFFGLKNDNILQRGLSRWVDSELERFVSI